ncbi:F-box family protein, putative isoform 2 [Hibiscus syriacus]|uniref:F-box family protein, putative isoform 2 n=1 Tax=Hibiscus syriacus TaxID=106335 RepID=A0A6A2WCR6_HIBSY|nr:F-box family protein, putative isoform 2 [Hibiscus syriacus]
MANTSYRFSLSKHIVFLLRSPKSNTETDRSTSWVVKIEEDGPNNKVQLLNPLSRSRFDSLPEKFPKSFNLLEFSIVELGEEYMLHYLNHLSYLGDAGNLYMEKEISNVKYSYKKWTIIQDMSSPYDEVILYEGNFYAVDNNGRTVLVGLDFETSEAAMPVFGGDKKFLVDSKDELLLVDKYLSIEAPEGSCSWAGLDFVEEYFENVAFYMNERTVRFNVFMLDEVRKQWVDDDVKNLNDRVLFLGDDCSFFASVEDLNVCRGNIIIFADNFFYSLGDDESSDRCDVGVFGIEYGSIGPLQKFPQFSKLFWPPPRWTSTRLLDPSSATIGIRARLECVISAYCLCGCHQKWELSVKEAMTTKFDIEKFNGRNFSLWKLKMKVILRKDGSLAAINERPVDFVDDIKWNEMDGNDMANFHLALADEVLSSIEEKKTTKEIWDHLTKLYEATSLHNKIFLKRKLYTLRMPESTSVMEHLNTLNTLFSQLTSLSCKIGEQERAELLFQAAVLQEENRHKNKEDRQVNLQQAEALTTMRGRSTERGQSSSHKHGRSKSRSKKNLKCYNCGKNGHLKKDCWSLNKNSNPQGNTANTSDDGDALCCEASTTVEGRKRFEDIWLINSGATYHMTSRREWFHHYEPVSGGSVYSCNDHALEIVGVGTIKLKMHDGTIKVVRDVRHVFRGALVVLKGEKIAANLYMLKGETLLEAEASVASCSSDSAMLWHKKLGHMSEQGMKVLVEQKLLPGLTKVSLTLCEHCIISNQHRFKFNTSNSRGKSVLELVHSNVWKTPVTSLREAKYFVSFIDYYSRRCWVYPIKKKSDVFSTFKNFKARVELDSGNKIKCFRTNNGGEYTSEEFDDFCMKEGIKRQFTVANTPQQNGVAERMDITLLERTRAMLRDACLEKSFWAEAVNTTCYLVNRAPSTAIELKTPMEMWTGKPADYSNLHIFGSIVYVMYNSQEISKLDPKSRKCKFLGYADGVKGYRLWDPTARKVIISRDVIFVEDKLQRKEDDDSAEKLETTQIHMEKEFEEEDSSEAEPTHDEQEPESSEAPTTRQSDRVRRRPNWHSDYVIEGNIAYCLLTEDGRKPIGNKWVFKIKRNGDDQVERYRARLVVKGYAQKEEQLDVKTTFLHGNLEEEIYMLKPEGFEEDEKKNLVCRLNKSLYGLKQAPRCWYKRFDSFIMCLGYNRLNAYPCAYFKRSGDNDFVILLLYVDGMLVAGPNKDHIEELKAQLAREFEMKDLGSANKILGMQIHRDRSNRKIWLSQKNFLKKILSRFSMQDCKPISTPLPINFKLSSSMSPSSEEERMEMSRVPYESALRSLMFAMICTRPDITQAVGVVSRYMANPGKEH